MRAFCMAYFTSIDVTFIATTNPFLIELINSSGTTSRQITDYIVDKCNQYISSLYIGVYELYRQITVSYSDI